MQNQFKPHPSILRRMVAWPLVAILFPAAFLLYEAFMFTQAVCVDIITWGES